MLYLVKRSVVCVYIPVFIINEYLNTKGVIEMKLEKPAIPDAQYKIVSRRSIVKLNFEIYEDEKNKFKEICASKGLFMTDMFRKLINFYCKNNGNIRDFD